MEQNSGLPYWREELPSVDNPLPPHRSLQGQKARRCSSSTIWKATSKHRPPAVPRCRGVSPADAAAAPGRRLFRIRLLCVGLMACEAGHYLGRAICSSRARRYWPISKIRFIPIRPILPGNCWSRSRSKSRLALFKSFGVTSRFGSLASPFSPALPLQLR